MRIVIASIVAAAGLAPATHGAINTRLDFQVSLDGTNFSDTVAAMPGDTVQVRATVTYIGTEPALGLASLIFQPAISNALPGDAGAAYVANGLGGNTTFPSGVISDAAGQYGRISPWGRNALSPGNQIANHFHTGGSNGAPAGGWLRVAQADATDWMGTGGNMSGGDGVPIGQLNNVGRTANDPPFESSTFDVAIFRFAITLDANVTNRPELVIDAPAEGFGNLNGNSGEREVYWFASMNEPSGSIRGTATIDGARISLVPTPGAGMVITLAGLCVARRRR